ncbi:MAG: GyrI-like domain-containing protein [Dysgonomonas sp.]
MNSTEIKNLNPIKTIAISHIGDYSEICKAFEKLATWASENNLWTASPKMAGIYHNDPRHTPINELRSEACLEDLSSIEPGEGMKHYTISGGKYFVMQVEVTMAEYNEAWKQVYTVVNEKGYECNTCDHYELYVSCVGDTQNPDAPWIVDLCIPIK